MQLLHQQENGGYIRGRRKISPSSSASIVGRWDIMPLSAPGRKAREKLPTQRLLQQRWRRMSRLMMIVP